MDTESGAFKHVVARNEDQAKRKAQNWVKLEDFVEVTATLWVHVYILRGWVKEFTRDRIVTDLSVTVDPREPTCTHLEHDWLAPQFLGGARENPGVWGHGGGVIVTECCSHCGQYRITDTWATNPSDGRQGLTSITYRKADACSLQWLGVVA